MTLQSADRDFSYVTWIVRPNGCISSRKHKTPLKWAYHTGFKCRSNTTTYLLAESDTHTRRWERERHMRLPAFTCNHANVSLKMYRPRPCRQRGHLPPQHNGTSAHQAGHVSSAALQQNILAIRTKGSTPGNVVRMSSVQSYAGAQRESTGKSCPIYAPFCLPWVATIGIQLMTRYKSIQLLHIHCWSPGLSFSPSLPLLLYHLFNILWLAYYPQFQAVLQSHALTMALNSQSAVV